MPVAALLEFLFDDISDEQDLAAAQQIGDNKGCESRYKYHDDAAYNTGQTERKDDLPEGVQLRGTQISGCRYNVFVNLGQNIVQRQHHKGQEVVHHAQYNGVRRIDELDGGQVKKI